MVLMWMITGFTYYLVQNQLKYIPGNIYHHHILEGLGEVVADLSAVVILKYIGYRKTLVIGYLIAAISMAALAIYIET